MKKVLTILILLLCLLVSRSALSEAAASLTLSESLKAFKEASGRFEEDFHNYMPAGKMSEGEYGQSFYSPISNSDTIFRPLFNLGVDKKSMEENKGSFGWISVEYEDNGNDFRIVCTTPKPEGNANFAQRGRDIYEGTYDPAADRFLCRVLRGDALPDGPEEYIIEYRRTDFGYAAQYIHHSSSYKDTSVYKLAFRDGEGIVGLNEVYDDRDFKFEALLGNEKPDYPKKCGMWWELSKKLFTVKPFTGPAREYKIKR